MLTTRSAALAGLPLLALLLAGCGSSSAPSTATPAPAASRPAGGGGGQPGVVGLVAAVDGTEVQVQNRAQGQVAVDVTGKTRITALTVAKKTDVAAGDCLTATGTPAAAGNGLTATTLTISPASGGSCTGNRRGAGSGPGGGGGPSRRPRPSGAPNPPAGPRLSSLIGTVKSVSGDTVTVAGVLRTPGERNGTAPASRTLTVTIGASTKIQRQATATKAAIRTGQCLAAFGPSNSIGAVQAGTVSVFPPTGGACTGGFGGGFGGRGMRGGNGNGTGAGNGN